MARYSRHAIRVAQLLVRLHPDVTLAPALERQMGRSPRTVDVTPEDLAPRVPTGEPPSEEPSR